MAFECEWLDEDARKKNNVNVTNWVVDKDREISLWIEGKHWQIRADGDYSETVKLRIKNQGFTFELMPDDNFRHYVAGAVHNYEWNNVIEYWPKDLRGYSYDELINIIKEGLTVEGGGGFDNQEYPNFIVTFNF
jgi:hypothetical protein